MHLVMQQIQVIIMVLSFGIVFTFLFDDYIAVSVNALFTGTGVFDDVISNVKKNDGFPSKKPSFF